MQVYTIPTINTPMYPFLIMDTSNTIPSKCISHSLSFFLQDIKEKIHVYEKEWDNYKKYTNIYEYIHTNNPHKKKSVSKYKPLSRSYFKMIELINEFDLLDYIPNHPGATRPIRSFHLAEGPGGFIEAVVNLRNNPNDTYIGMTIQDDKHEQKRSVCHVEPERAFGLRRRRNREYFGNIQFRVLLS